MSCHCENCDDCRLWHCQMEVVRVPDTGSFIVIDGVVTKDPTPEQVRAAFGCSMGCR